MAGARRGLDSACSLQESTCGLLEKWLHLSADDDPCRQPAAHPLNCRPPARSQVCRHWKAVLESPESLQALWGELTCDFSHELITGAASWMLGGVGSGVDRWVGSGCVGGWVADSCVTVMLPQLLRLWRSAPAHLAISPGCLC